MYDTREQLPRDDVRCFGHRGVVRHHRHDELTRASNECRREDP